LENYFGQQRARGGRNKNPNFSNPYTMLLYKNQLPPTLFVEIVVGSYGDSQPDISTQPLPKQKRS